MKRHEGGTPATVPPYRSRASVACCPGLRDLLVYRANLWENVVLVVLLWNLADWIVFYGVGKTQYFRWSNALRPFLLVAKIPSVRDQLTAVYRTLLSMVQITALFTLVIVFYAVVGTQLFNDGEVTGYSRDNDNFNSFGAASLSIFMLQTTENFPDILYPALKTRPVAALVFFLSALFFFLWLILPLFLAIVFRHYLYAHKRSGRRGRALAYLSLVAAYKTLCLIAARRRARLEAGEDDDVEEEEEGENGTVRRRLASSRIQLRDLCPMDDVDRGVFVEFLRRLHGVRPGAAEALLAALNVEEEDPSVRL